MPHKKNPVAKNLCHIHDKADINCILCFPDEKEYRVTVKEVHHQDYLIFAESAKEARALVAKGEGEIDEAAFFYANTLHPDTFYVELAE